MVETKLAPESESADPRQEVLDYIKDVANQVAHIGEFNHDSRAQANIRAVERFLTDKGVDLTNGQSVELTQTQIDDISRYAHGHPTGRTLGVESFAQDSEPGVNTPEQKAA